MCSSLFLSRASFYKYIYLKSLLNLNIYLYPAAEGSKLFCEGPS